jgi:hypothetical protein
MNAFGKSVLNTSYDDCIDNNHRRASTSTAIRNSSDRVEEAAAATAAASSKHLNFYESMYNFKKMFPRIDTDVIESVLRANNGKIDKTIDDLLNLNPENESSSSHHMFINNFSSSNINESSLTSSLPACLFEDSPPSYFELMKKENFSSVSCMRETSQILTSETRRNSLHAINHQTAQDTIRSKENHSAQKSNSCLSSLNSSRQQQQQQQSVNQTPFESNHEKSSSNAAATKQTFLTKTINNRQILIGNLSKDFLRIKLNSQQIKAFKSSIKKARRNELTAILNEKQPEYPDLSFQMRKKLNILENGENKTQANPKNSNNKSIDMANVGSSSSSSSSSSHNSVLISSVEGTVLYS